MYVHFTKICFQKTKSGIHAVHNKENDEGMISDLLSNNALPLHKQGVRQIVSLIMPVTTNPPHHKMMYMNISLHTRQTEPVWIYQCKRNFSLRTKIVCQGCIHLCEV